MAFAASARQDTMSDINITPLVDVMLVLLVIFMVTAPMLDLRIGMKLPQSADPPPPPSPTLALQVEPGDMFLLDGVAMTPAQLERTLADWHVVQPEGVLKIDVNPDADYQSAATAMAVAQRAGVENSGLVEH